MSTAPYVLIVDDDTNMGQTLADMVGLFDWNTQVVSSPRAAIESLQRNVPSLILLDLNMPGVDGMEVCRFIKRDPIAGDTPVVFVTAEDDPGTKVRAREAGAMDYLVKPVDIDRLEELLQKVPRKITVLKAAEKPEAEKTTVSTESAKSAMPAPDTSAVVETEKKPDSTEAVKPVPPAKETVASTESVQPEPAKPAPPTSDGSVTAEKKGDSTESAKPEPPAKETVTSTETVKSGPPEPSSNTVAKEPEPPAKPA